MQFEPNHIYHIFNRGNNSQKIFFTRENYLFFLKKVKLYVLPYADLLAWCLMPNHFHLMTYVNHLKVNISEQVTESHQLTRKGTGQVTGSHQLTKSRSINESISILLRSYTRAIQKQENFTGSLFQHRTKSICLTDISGVTPAWFETTFGASINIPDGEKDYPQVCFNYIHENPATAGMVKNAGDWEFSSYRDYSGIRDGKLINRERAAEFELHI
jgi:putative transposase